MPKTTNVFVLLDSISMYEREVGRSLTTEEKVAIIMDGLRKDTAVGNNKKRHKK